MICPNCEYEYIEGVTICPDCGSELIPKEEFDGKLVHPSDWVVIFTTGTLYEAEMLKSNLEGAGIESLILSQKDSCYPAVGDLAIVKLLVKKDDTDEAQSIIKDINTRQIQDDEE